MSQPRLGLILSCLASASSILPRPRSRSRENCLTHILETTAIEHNNNNNNNCNCIAILKATFRWKPVILSADTTIPATLFLHFSVHAPIMPSLPRSSSDGLAISPITPISLIPCLACPGLLHAIQSWANLTYWCSQWLRNIIVVGWYVAL